MKWKALQMPKRIEVDESTASSTYGQFVIEPLERGFGTTLGNSLRRVLLSSLQGAAPTAIKIDGVLHEFSTVPGVYEDVAEIILNVKKLVCRLHSDEPRWIRLTSNKPGPVRAADFELTSDVEILNPDAHVCTLGKGAELNMEVEIGSGRGYVPAEQQEETNRPIGVIPMDAIFTPVPRVNYRVSETRVGERTDYDSLALEVWTNGTILPREAVSWASKIIKDHLVMMIDFEEEPVAESEPEVDQEKERIKELLLRSVEELELSVRCANCLQAADIRTIADLVTKSEHEMLKYRNFGRKSLKEIQDILDGMNLKFDMDVSAYVSAEELTAARDKAERETLEPAT